MTTRYFTFGFDPAVKKDGTVLEEGYIDQATHDAAAEPLERLVHLRSERTP
mgnify:CR=1 FL=1